MSEEFKQIEIARIRLSTTASQTLRRQHFDKTALGELAASIKSHGVLQPIIVRPSKGVKYEFQLVAGERRLAASRLAELTEIPAVVRELTDEQVIEVQLIENLQRADLHPMEEAEGYHQLMQKHGHPIEDLYTKVGKSRSYVYGRLKLLALVPRVRKAFYENKINASIALLLARIPVDKLQGKALTSITSMHMSVRRANEHIQRNYMLKLANSYFPKNDAELVPKAGSCETCPKRTGNEPDLFRDAGGYVCTDPICFANKTRAHGKRRIAAAKAQGQPVIAGQAARKIVRWGDGPRDLHLDGYRLMTDKVWSDPKRRTARQIVGKDVETTLLQHPREGFVVEVIKESVINAALWKGKKRPASSPQNAQAKKAKIERAFRVALYDRLRPKLSAPTLQVLAAALWCESQHDTIKIVAKLQGWEPKKSSWGGKDFRGLAKKIPELRGKALHALINDLIFATELQVPTWSTSKPEQLLAAAKKYGINAAAVRRAVAPKKKKAKKKARARRKA